jgi:hypothetical protein
LVANQDIPWPQLREDEPAVAPFHREGKLAQFESFRVTASTTLPNHRSAILVDLEVNESDRWDHSNELGSWTDGTTRRRKSEQRIEQT